MPNGPQNPSDVEINHLGHGQEPPDDQDWILVEVAASGTFVHTRLTAGLGAMIQGPFASIEDAVDAAKHHAVERGMHVIYAKGIPHHA